MYIPFRGVSEVLDHYKVKDVSLRDAIGISRALANNGLSWGADPLDRYLFECEEESAELDTLNTSYGNFYKEWGNLLTETAE